MKRYDGEKARTAAISLLGLTPSVSIVQARTKELEGLQLRVEELQAQVLSMEGTKGWFERRLKEAEVIIIHCPLRGHGAE